MKKVILGGLGGLVLGGLAGFAAGIFVFPYLFPPPPVNETVAVRTDQDVLARGTFIHADPADPLHYGRGSVTIYDGLLHLESDFEVGPGPRFHVYLVPDADVTAETPVQNAEFVDLGRLKAFTGSQNYPIPADVDPNRYRTVVIWCAEFHVLISPAELTFI